MMDFQPMELRKKAEFDAILQHCGQQGCEYSFANLYLWGRQQAAFHQSNLAFFSQFNRRSVYLFPLGQDLKPTLDAIIQDARERGIPCRLTGLTQDDLALLERLYPGRFRYHFDRNSFDYVYDINDLADLQGRKYQKKRNHLNRFLQAHPDFSVEPITEKNLPEVAALVDRWYTLRLQEEPHSDFHMERTALTKALKHRQELGIEGLLLKVDGEPAAMTMGSFLNDNTFDVHFEKSLDRTDGAYPAINREFARYLRSKYPSLRWLNREDDMGLEGLRKAKLSYYPDHMIEKSWVCLLEDGYDY